MGHDAGHPPFPVGATSRELSTVQQLHRAAEAVDEINRRAILEGVGLLVKLIEGRGRRRAFEDAWDGEHDEA